MVTDILNSISPTVNYIFVIGSIVVIFKFLSDIKKEISNNKTEIKQDINNLRVELKKDINNLDIKIEKLNSKFDMLNERLNSTNQSLFYTIPRVERLENQFFTHHNGATKKAEQTTELEC